MKNNVAFAVMATLFAGIGAAQAAPAEPMAMVATG